MILLGPCPSADHLKIDGSAVAGQLCEAEVGDPHLTTAVEHNVGRFQVALQHASIVRGRQSGVVINHDFTIAAGEKRYKVEAPWEVAAPIYGISAFPHMHLLGKEMKVTATPPNGTAVPLVWIKDWDFN